MRNGTLRSNSVSAVGMRQTVLNGSVDANGFPNALSAGTGLSATLSAATTPMLIAFAAGFDAYGCVDYTAQVTANQTISGLTASSTLYLYADRNVTTGAITFGFYAALTTYSYKAPTSPATNATWFDLSTFTFKQYNGTAWNALQRVLLGEATTNGSAVTGIITYAYQGYYQSLWQAVVGQTSYTFSHNLGIPIASASALATVFTSPTGSDTDAVVATPDLNVGATDYGYQWLYPSGAAMQKAIVVATKTNPVLTTANSFQTTGYYKLDIRRGW